jgi:hypothetical protein
MNSNTRKGNNRTPTPGETGTSQNALSKLVEAAKRQFRLIFPTDEHDFESSVWYVGHLSHRSTTTSNPRLYFTRAGTTKEPLPKTYSQVIKSWLLLEFEMGTRSAVAPLNAGRILWEAILMRQNNLTDGFCWEQLCDEDLNQAESLMLEHWAQGTTYKAAWRLVSFCKFLANKNICRPLYYSPQTPRLEDSNRCTIAGREERTNKLPTGESLDGLAEIYRLAKDPADILLSAAMAIAVAAGFRIGELLTLPLDCEANEIRKNKRRYGLRYYKEKNKNDENLFEIRWLSSLQAELARDAIAKIKSLTEASRQRAVVLEQDSTRVSIPNIKSERFTVADLSELLGFSTGTSVSKISSNELVRHKDAKGFYYLRADIEEYLLTKRTRRLWTVDRKDGTYQMLSQTLLIAPRNFFHSRRGTNYLLVEPLTVLKVSDFLAGRAGVRSAFERFNILEPNGNFCRLTSHQLRYWLNDIADKGGLPVDTLTRWMGRDNPKDTEAYRFETADEKCERIKDGVRTGDIRGYVSEVYFSLPEGGCDVFLESQVQSVHLTPMGICIHDYSLSPCDRHLNCVRGTCPDYLRTKGDQRERNNLREVLRNTKAALISAQDEVKSENGNLASAWVRHHEETIAGAEAALAVDDDMEIEDGVMIRPFQPGRQESAFGLQ